MAMLNNQMVRYIMEVSKLGDPKNHGCVNTKLI